MNWRTIFRCIFPLQVISSRTFNRKRNQLLSVGFLERLSILQRLQVLRRVAIVTAMGFRSSKHSMLRMDRISFINQSADSRSFIWMDVRKGIVKKFVFSDYERMKRVSVVSWKKHAQKYIKTMNVLCVEAGKFSWKTKGKV